MKSRSLVLLSGEGTTLPAAEARALYLTYDPAARFEPHGPRVLMADSTADPFRVASRIAFARRVGPLVESRRELAGRLGGHRVRFRSFDLRTGGESPDPGEYLEGLGVVVDLRNPEYEVTLVRGEDDYLAVTAPGSMVQGWSRRRPRKRPFFHPSAMFPKLARAMVNMSRCPDGGVFLDPFSGTGSIPMEALLVGARVVAADVAGLMTMGAMRNMRHFGQEWMGVVRADSTSLPFHGVDAVATDIPYGRASSTRGRGPRETIELLLGQLQGAMAPGSFIALMHPQDVTVPESSGLSLLEEHHLHVHKLLTRTISVLERR